MAKDKEKPPKGGWLGPTGHARNVPAEAVLIGKKLKPVKLTEKDKKKRAKFFEKMKKADKKGIWSW